MDTRSFPPLPAAIDHGLYGTRFASLGRNAGVRRLIIVEKARARLSMDLANKADAASSKLDDGVVNWFCICLIRGGNQS